MVEDRNKGLVPGMTPPSFVDNIIAKSGMTREEWDRQRRARTWLMTRIFQMQSKRLEVTDELLKRRCTI